MESKIDLIIREVRPGQGLVQGDYQQFRETERNLIWTEHQDLYDRGLEYIHGWERDTEDDYGLPRGSCRGFNLIFDNPAEVRRHLYRVDIRDALRNPLSRIVVILDHNFNARTAWIRLPNGILSLKN